MGRGAAGSEPWSDILSEDLSITYVRKGAIEGTEGGNGMLKGVFNEN